MFVTFEGPEGAGKSTVLRSVASALRTSGRGVLETREPGAGAFGARVREWLLHGEAMTARAELMLFLADRAEHVARLVRPALERGEIVLCDRHADSTVVYQGYARGLDLNFLREANAFATGGLQPDITFLLDLPAADGIARAKGGDRLDAEPIEFHEKVRAGFLSESLLQPERWHLIDARQTQDQVSQQVLDAIRRRL